MENNISPEQYAAMTGIITAALEALKKLPIVEKVKPYFVFVAIALAFGYFWSQNGADAETLKSYIIPSVMVGLSASGLYSGVKALSNNKPKPK